MKTKIVIRLRSRQRRASPKAGRPRLRAETPHFGVQARVLPVEECKSHASRLAETSAKRARLVFDESKRAARCHWMPVVDFLRMNLAEVKAESALTKAGLSRYHGLCPWGSILVAIVMFLSSGCATQKDRQTIANLKEHLGETSQKFELAKKENLNLKRELTLFKKYQDIDSYRFIRGLEFFEKYLSTEISEGDVWVRISDRGLVITVSAEKLFMTASDALSDAGKAFLDKITEVIQKDFSVYYLYIEGHTDNQSLAVFEWKTDWDFSFARALTVLKYFTEKKGMNPLKLSASGFGQYRPRAANDSKEGRRLNRRVVIIISPQRIKNLKS